MQTELHRHLDVSIRPSTLLELAKARTLIPESTSLEGFCEDLLIRRPLKDLTQVLGQFALYSKVLDRPESLARVGFEVVEDCFQEGTRKVELRFSPTFIAESSSLSWSDILRSLEEGIAKARAKYPDIQVGLLCIASRDYGVEAVAETVDFFLANRGSFVGLDLAGNEADFPCRLFEQAFKKARDAKAKITIHAGEAVGPENIWEAIELLGARRIGHGVTSVKDPELMKFLAKNRICLEMCPSSNWVTRAVPSIETHPLPQILQADVPVCVNTDDPGIFGVTLPYEIRLCRDRMGMSEEELRRCEEHAEASSFIGQ